MDNAIKAIRAKLQNKKVDFLLSLWNETERLEGCFEVYAVRGALMDEFADRNPTAFEKWMDSESMDIAIYANA